MSSYIFTRIHLYLHILIYTHTTLTLIYVYIHPRIYVHIYTYVYIYFQEYMAHGAGGRRLAGGRHVEVSALFEVFRTHSVTRTSVEFVATRDKCATALAIAKAIATVLIYIILYMYVYVNMCIS